MTLVTVLVLQACSGAPQADVIAADGALCDLTRRLAANDLKVSCLLGPEDDPHQVQLTPEQTRQIRRSRLVLINGYGLTPILERLPNAVKVAERAVPDSPALSPSHDEAHGHGDRDPHVWHDPRQAAAMVDLVALQLTALKPKAADRIEARAEAMQAGLQALHSWNQRQFSTIPAPRTLASGHRAFASLARAYNLRELALLDAGSASETLRPQALAAAINSLRSSRVKSLFAEQTPAASSLVRISSLSGVPLAARPLRADAAGVDLMATLTANTCLIVEQLGGRCDQAGRDHLIRSWDAIR